ncbi:DUF5103 domain-containing protein [Tenacibaculum sp. UWU-22]|uniref:type IX secretion system plug protein n=1 Tax=Tenacibaculum sp. UWU-22 TaxID=3234187 RepID=UPI0034DB32D1
MKLKLFLFINMFLCSLLLNAQQIKTIQLRPLNSGEFSAIVPLGSVLKLSFDDLDGDSKEYQYKIEHMTHDWKPSNLITSQYVRGFNQNVINNISNSFNTLQSYTHYSVEIPNKNTVITKSGNYLISVLTQDDEVVFTRRCVFYEKAVDVGVSVYRSRDLVTIDQQQMVQFLINYPNLRINNPSQEIYVTLLQNYNWDTQIKGIKPQYYSSHQLLYKYTRETNFWGGNEYLNFDNKYIRNTSVNISHTRRKDVYHNYLYTDESRSLKPYTYYPDINGFFIVRTLDANDNNTESDYAMIHFSLAASKPFKNKTVYVYGAFNNFELTNENKMSYNVEKGIYETHFLLKQGFYNYSYVTVDENGIIDLTEIDGSFYQTENKYTVLVYYKPFGGLYERVIGVGEGFFNQDK